MSRNLNSMNLMHFAAFRAVMLCGTVSGAAQILGRSQPAVSRILDRLEHDLGLTLFERRKGAISPTAEAWLLLEEVERAHLALDSLRTASERIAGGEDRSIHLAVLPALGYNFLPDVLAEFARHAPGVQVKLSVRMSASVEEWAAAGRIDFGLAERPLRRSGFTKETFTEAPYAFVVPKGHPLENREVLTPEDLHLGPLISWSNFVPVHALLEQAMEAYGKPLNAAYETNLSGTALNLVRRGLGIALIDPFTAARGVDDSMRVIPFIPRIPFHLTLVIPDGRVLTPSMRLFLKIMKDMRDRTLKSLPQ